MIAWAAGTQLGPYVLDSRIGAGGMGEVWKARDTRLNRSVAVKRLTQQSERLEQETRAIAALNHPHICQIYDVGPNYLVLEYIEGQTLADRITSRPLSLEHVVRLAIQIAGAIEEAHRRGVIHRDLKPANIMIVGSSPGSSALAVNDSRNADVLTAKLLDFGLAKLVTGDVNVTRTVDGTTLGTAAYMSPEQAQGRPADARSDVFSFGAVLYEMLAGRRAFEGDSMVEVLNAVLRADPQPLQAPAAFESIVRRCLQKQPEQRFQTMEEVRTALEHSARTSVSVNTSAPQASIAVLPFADMSVGKDHEWFSDGLSEEIINALVQVPGLTVIARTSAFAFKGKHEDVRRIAEALGVAHVLEGSVRRAGDRVRVTAQLITAANGSHLWSERYDRTMADVFEVQDEIARAIATTLQVKLSAEGPASPRYTPNLPAYEAYLKARHHWGKLTPDALARSKEYFERAIELDPDFGEAHIGLADWFLLMTTGLGLLPAHETIPLVRAAAQKALDVNPSLPEAHAMLGVVAGIYDYNWGEAERRFRLAMARDPVPARVRSWYAYFYLGKMGRPREAAEEMERGLPDDPMNLMYRLVLATSLLGAGRHEAACTECRRILEFDENYWHAHFVLATALAERGMFAEALAVAERCYGISPWNTGSTGLFAGLLMSAGDRSRAEQVVRTLTNRPGSYGAPLGLAIFHSLCGEADRAVDWIEKGIEQRHPMMCDVARWHLRSSTHWPAVAKMMNLPVSP